ncbi:NAD(P)-dependent oxidoreductase [Bradyrhizobium australiense]|uniref:NAD(P)-dependent oxidoreductase n=1 Tax=Bradyrhizobium australiense TaxID=2721161 RepID=UPI0024BFAA72|nr:NAD(P)-dependent oxidoreductase [Bradyrhizobium australiense]
MLHWDFRRFLQERAERKWNPRYVRPLAEKTLGVVGLGSIGATVARRAKSAGMTVIGRRGMFPYQLRVSTICSLPTRSQICFRYATL